MKEHRVIERAIAAVTHEIERTRISGKVDVEFLDLAIDFMNTYADMTHHGKEEDILFALLERKPLDWQERETMAGLIEEHRFVRAIASRLSEIRHGSLYAGEMVGVTVVQLQRLTEVYPRHIEKEDMVFFPAAMRYLTSQERIAMNTDFRDFDSSIVHEKYARVAASLGRYAPSGHGAGQGS